MASHQTDPDNSDVLQAASIQINQNDDSNDASCSSNNNINNSNKSSRTRSNKSHVLRACVNCRKAHLACDTDRPCKRCVSLGKEDSCYDVDHKKRGRPKLRHNNKITKPGTPMKQSSFVMTHLPVRVLAMPDPSPTREGQTVLPSPVVTAFLSMENCCARVSDEIQMLLGYYPQELAHRSLYAFIAQRSSQTLARLHRVLLDNVTQAVRRSDPTYQQSRMPFTERTTSDKFFSTDPNTLTAIANGSQTVADTLWFKRSEGSLEPLLAQFYLGGGLGADLYAPETLGNLYIVCLLSKPSRPEQQQSEPAPSQQPTATSVQSSLSSPASSANNMTTSLSPWSMSTPVVTTQQQTPYDDDQSSASRQMAENKVDSPQKPSTEFPELEVQTSTVEEYSEHGHRHTSTSVSARRLQHSSSLTRKDTSSSSSSAADTTTISGPILLTHPSSSSITAFPSNTTMRNNNPAAAAPHWSRIHVASSTRTQTNTLHHHPADSSITSDCSKFSDYVQQKVAPLRLFPATSAARSQPQRSVVQEDSIANNEPNMAPIALAAAAATTTLLPPSSAARSTQQTTQGSNNSFMSVDALLS